MSSKIDTDVSNYTLEELMAIVGLDDLDPEEIIKKTNFYVEKYKTTDPNLSIFFQSIKDGKLSHCDGPWTLSPLLEPRNQAWISCGSEKRG